ncbi:phenylacetate--CoA ligase family protein [Paenibacillus humicus]|uniref:phenylacetate--CoA ligase family protein n=1 Tax=Paenibacillus humicus TaxID=412861 RepID=UPI000FDCB1B7|nr:phenylacetate--CoA ligase family protein [Paenibacillus humicus]
MKQNLAVRNEANVIFFEHRKQQIYEMYRNCIENVPFYRNRWNLVLAENQFNYDSFTAAVPILEKNEAKQFTDMLISDRYRKEELLVDITSGTEGTPLICYKSKEERIRCSNALWKKRREWLRDLSPGDKFARFYTFRSGEDKSLIINSVIYKGNDIHIPLNDMSSSKLSEYWAHIVAFQPRWMHGPPTAIARLALHINQMELPFHQMEFIELNGEIVTKDQLRLIQESFRCKVANHYGSREFWALGFSCEVDGHLHALDRSVFIETRYNANFQTNEILVTSLTNKAWPLVRYRLGDMADLHHPEDLNCGAKEPFTLNMHGGRRADYFTLQGGLMINAILFSGIARAVSGMQGKSAVSQYQAIKESNNLLTIKLCLNKESLLDEEALVGRFDEELRKIIGSEIKICYEIVDVINPDVRTGKCRDFIDLTLQL